MSPGSGPSRRRVLVAITLVALAIALLGAGPWAWHHYLTRDGARDLHDLASLPRSLHPCERTYGDPAAEPRTLAELRAFLGQEPPIVDPLPLSSCPTGLAARCPSGMCTPTVVWVRVGEDAYVGYSLRGGP